MSLSRFIVLDSGYIYRANFENGTSGQILKVPAGGGGVVALAGGLNMPVGVAVAGNSAYFTTYLGTVGKITPK